MKFLSKSAHSFLSSPPPFRQWGQALAEFALMLPVFLVILFVLIEGAFIIQGYLTVQHAAREAARWAVTYQPVQGAKIDETDCDGKPTGAGSDLSYYVGDDVDAGNVCDIAEDEDEYNARRVALIEKVALQRAAGLRINWDARGLTGGTFDAYQNEPGFFGVRVTGATWDGTQIDHAGAPGLPVTVTVVHRVELVDPFLRVIAPDGVRVQASANMVNEGVLVIPPGSSSSPGNPAPVTQTPPQYTPVPPPTPTLPPEADYCLQISFDHVTNTLPFERGHDVDVLVTDCNTGDPWPDLPVSFSTTEGAYDYSGVEDPDGQYAEAMTGGDGIAVRTVYANEPGTAELRTWVDLDGDDSFDAGERFDLAYKTWTVPEDEPYILASSYEVLPEEWINVDVFNHPVADEPFTLLWCRISGAGIASSVLITDGIDVDVDGNALDLPVEIPAGSAGAYQLETHTEYPAVCGNVGTRVAYSAEIRIGGLPPDLQITSISYPDTYGDVFPAFVDVPLSIQVENLLPWPVEDTLFDIDLYVSPPVTPTQGQFGDEKQWLASIAGYGTEVVTVELRIEEIGIYQLWAQVDTTNYIEEADETNNIFGPYQIDVDCTVFSSDYGDDFDDGSFDSKWSTVEIGTGVNGSVTEDGGGYLQIHGLGSSIWNDSDSFFYVYQSISGDFDVRLRAISPPPNSGAKVGVMIRNSAAANSRHVMATARDADGRRLQFAYRAGDGNDTYYSGSELDPAPTPPVWLRIVRNGGDFAYYYSYANIPGSGDWTLRSNGATVNMGDSVLVGIAHAKYSSSGSPYTSQVDEFVVCPVPEPPPPPPPPPGLRECTQLFSAQDFEGNLSNVFPPWQAGNSPGAWQRDGYFPHLGAFSVHLHASQATWPCDTTPPYNPWVAQTVEIPTTTYTMTSITVEGFRAVGGSRAECSIYGSTDADDALYVELLDGATGNPLTTPPPGLIVDGGVVTDTWQRFSVDFAGIDLQPYAGQNVRVRFYTVHDGDRYGTYFYLDDLECNFCTEWPIPAEEPGTASIGGKVQVVVSNITLDMPGVTVVAYSQGGEVYQTLSIHNGTYHFYNIPPGTYTIYAQAWVSGGLRIDSATVTVVSDERNYYVNLMLR